ncbi:2-keto-4-pentenoate hydratase/2-oxohepta-3-ene-1,7-dioic acid hydratase in catechol pathway [Panacagrimonas perspica]|uniref:2-keto-4-pentenoate hydratase/2-oxohepta-3-ene-1,7-dioic acid hydratase in catechol pathway n=1 Tax=Panacagrimonas perspica TaxID=381431 RepID=A0A4R7P3B3_9GAMM|nr:fumarylacetoacetate hydrolase family protein [Panacagrimonas perspica]TDU28245.1 2-keto-4-pentenoate hydratase/2-oxohepta-3-ene-1,7-dioic acid hydratase in catechol pathway [Panacagrimonas perspica]THD04294.1 5-carboxymethyl-2-hydroxymuconate isomerase [Panacagrimonas perspica]
MRLAMVSLGDAPARPALITNDRVHDIGKHLPDAPKTMIGIIEALDSLEDALTKLAAGPGDQALKDVRLHAPVPRPGKILALGLNYKDHAAEANMTLPEIQTWFSKMTTSTNGPYDGIDLPRVSTKLDYEAELGVIIGKRARHVTREQARDVIAGYVVANDVSVRDWQLRTSQFVVGKSFDTHCPFGPWITTADEIPDPQALRIGCTVNGEVRQDSSTSEMVFDVFQMIEHLSQAMTLEPGDLLITGTPAGVGAVSKPPRYLKAGDVVRVEIEKLGFIENKVVPEPL